MRTTYVGVWLPGSLNCVFWMRICMLGASFWEGLQMFAAYGRCRHERPSMILQWKAYQATNVTHRSKPSKKPSKTQLKRLKGCYVDYPLRQSTTPIPPSVFKHKLRTVGRSRSSDFWSGSDAQPLNEGKSSNILKATKGKTDRLVYMITIGNENTQPL